MGKKSKMLRSLFAVVLAVTLVCGTLQNTWTGVYAEEEVYQQDTSMTESNDVSENGDSNILDTTETNNDDDNVSANDLTDADEDDSVDELYVDEEDAEETASSDMLDILEPENEEIISNEDVEYEDEFEEYNPLQLALGTTELASALTLTPTMIEMNRERVSVSASGNHTTAIKEDGSLWFCGWHGENSDDRLLWNGGSVVPNSTIRKIMEDVISVSEGKAHSMVIKTDNSLWAGGKNNYGQLGNGGTGYQQTFVKIMDGVVSVSAGGYHTMAIKADSSLWGWGLNSYGRLGIGNTNSQSTPVKIMDGVTSVSAGFSHTMAVKTDNSLWGWGVNSSGELGVDNTSNQLTPVKIMDDVVSVSTGSNYTMAIKTDGSLWAWGLNPSGQLGIGSTNNQLLPVKIMDNVASVSASHYGYHTMAIKSDGSLWGWGDNFYNQLGIESTGDQLTPVKIMDDVASVSAGEKHTLVIKTDGSLWGWGQNVFGQLGDGTTTNKYSPVQIMSPGSIFPDPNDPSNPEEIAPELYVSIDFEPDVSTAYKKAKNSSMQIFMPSEMQIIVTVGNLGKNITPYNSAEDKEKALGKNVCLDIVLSNTEGFMFKENPDDDYDLVTSIPISMGDVEVFDSHSKILCMQLNDIGLKAEIEQFDFVASISADNFASKSYIFTVEPKPMKVFIESYDGIGFYNNATGVQRSFDPYKRYPISDLYFDYLALANDYNPIDITLMSISRALPWSGSCYGMSAVVALGYNNLVHPNLWQNTAVCLNDLEAPTADNWSILNLINYYQMAQGVPPLNSGDYSIASRWLADQEKVLSNLYLTICDEISKGNVLVVGFNGKIDQHNGSHEIVIYAVDDTTYPEDNDYYYMKIWDPNFPNSSADYLKIAKDFSDCSFSYAGYEFKSIHSVVTVDLLSQIRNPEDLISSRTIGKTSVEHTESHNTLYVASNEKYSIESLTGEFAEIDGFDISGTLDVVGPVYLSGLDWGQKDNLQRHKVYIEKDGKYMISGNSMKDVYFEFSDVLERVLSDNVKSVIFDSTGILSFDSKGCRYEASLTSNNYFGGLTWFTITAKGENSGNVEMRLHNNGAILKADNLNNITIESSNRTEAISNILNTDKHEVYIVPAPKNGRDVLAIYIDNDGDGVFETLLSEDSPINNEKNNSSSYLTSSNNRNRGYSSDYSPYIPLIASNDSRTPIQQVDTARNMETAKVNKRPRLNKNTAYIFGYPNGTIHPDNNITKAEVASIFYRLIDDNNKSAYKNNASRFADVGANKWYTEAIGYLASNGILSGYGDGSFRPESDITRAEFATLASQFEQLNTSGTLPFSDVTPNHWAYKYIASAHNHGWITGYPDGTFKLDRKITRAEAISSINRLLGKDRSPRPNSIVAFSDLSPNAWYYNDIIVAVTSN